MFQSLHVAATGLNTFEDEMTDITNNLANAKTNGFKVGRTDKESLFYIEKYPKSFNAVLSDTIARQQIDDFPLEQINFGSGVRTIATPKDYSQGSIETTKNPLDLAIQGEGFLKFKMPDGTIAYGRAGNLHMDNDGNVVDPNGHYLDPQVTLPEGTTKVVIRTDGTVFVNINNATNFTEVGQITIAKFTNPSGLKSLGQNLYAATDSSGDARVGVPGEDGFGSLTQYALELSNVDVVSEMMRMIITQRVFDTVTKAVQSYDSMLTAVERMKQ